MKTQNTIGHLMATRKWCYYVPEAQDTREHGGYVPSLVIADEPGHSPMLGQGKGASPWVWGQTLEQAREVCDKANADMGISPEQANRILASSMAVSRIRDPFTKA